MLQPQTGILAYITSNSWLKGGIRQAPAPLLRREALAHSLLLELGKDVFESAIVDSGMS